VGKKSRLLLWFIVITFFLTTMCTTVFARDRYRDAERVIVLDDDGERVSVYLDGDLLRIYDEYDDEEIAIDLDALDGAMDGIGDVLEELSDLQLDLRLGHDANTFAIYDDDDEIYIDFEEVMEEVGSALEEAFEDLDINLDDWAEDWADEFADEWEDWADHLDDQADRWDDRRHHRHHSWVWDRDDDDDDDDDDWRGRWDRDTRDDEDDDDARRVSRRHRSHRSHRSVNDLDDEELQEEVDELRDEIKRLQRKLERLQDREGG